MLTLKRRESESLRITVSPGSVEQLIIIKVIRVYGNPVAIGIDADRDDVMILRDELYREGE